MAPTVSQKDTQTLVNELRTLDKKFRRSCRQVVLLNQRITDLQARYKRAYRDDRKSFRYTLRLSLATTEGIRNMYYEYASRKADELEAVQDQLVEAGVLSDSEEDIDWEADDV